MCIAICKPQDIIIPDAHLEESFEYNPDGAGFMYAEDGELHIEKGFMTYQAFRDAWEPHQEKVAALHFRIKTHGAIDADNTHPFQVGKNLAFIHNGIISNVDTKEDLTKSDTYHFNEQFLSHIYRRDSRFIFKPHYSELVRTYIGGSKLVFLNNKGHYKIINEKMGNWDEGVWYSNNSYKPVQTYNRQKQPDVTPIRSFSNSFAIGDRVAVGYGKGNEKSNFTGTIRYFGAGMSVTVAEDDTNIERAVYLGFLKKVTLVLPAPEPINVFKEGDWVVRNDPAFGDTNQIGEVQGTTGQAVIVKFLNDAGLAAGPDYFINATRLEHWYSTQYNSQDY